MNYAEELNLELETIVKNKSKKVSFTRDNAF